MDTTCKGCGKPIKVKPKEIKVNGNYCSKSCWYASKSPRPSRKTGTNKTCEICGKAFYAQKVHSNQKYCSRKCKGIASRLPVKPCAACGKIFKPPFGKPEQPCCSRECGAIYRRSGEMRPCGFCGKDVWVTKGKLANKSLFFCNAEHANEYQGRNKTSHTCKICGKTFKWSPSRSKAYNITYCSIACRDNDPEQRERLIAMNAKQQRMSPNHIEVIGYTLLDSLNVAYERQYLIGKKFCVDAFIPSLNTVIQFDGDYWHGNPAFFPTLDTRQQKRARLDRSQDAYMEACGYSVIRIWASDLQKNLDTVMQRLRSLLVPHNS